jgi:hypothetical protein
MFSLTLALLLLTPAQADDLDLGFDMDDIELGVKDAKGQDLVTYQGNTSQNAPEYVAGTLVSVSHSGGTIVINCMERDGIAAMVDYSLQGTNRDALKRFGDGIGLKVWGGGKGGGVQTRVSSASSSIKSKTVPLVVSLPRKAKIRVNGGQGWVQVRGCTGSVSVANRSGDITISGTLTSISATAPAGSVTAHLTEASSMTGSSKITSGGGDVLLKIPSDYGGRIYAKGQTVKVRHLVDGSESGTLVQGTIGQGNASLTVTAKGSVTVETSK